MSGTTERRIKILNTLSRRRYDTIINLATEFGVSERTIRRDIDALSTVEPIYTQVGRYTGGVYIMDGCYADRKYLNSAQIRVLDRIIKYAKEGETLVLTDDEVECIVEIINSFSILH